MAQGLTEFFESLPTKNPLPPQPPTPRADHDPGHCPRATSVSEHVYLNLQRPHPLCWIDIADSCSWHSNLILGIVTHSVFSLLSHLATSRSKESHLISGGGTRNEACGSAPLILPMPCCKARNSAARGRGHTGFRMGARGGTCSDGY